MNLQQLESGQDVTHLFNGLKSGDDVTHLFEDDSKKKDNTKEPVKIETKNEVKQEPIKETPKQEPSFLSKVWHGLSEPLTDAPSRFAKTVSDYINPDSTTQGIRGIGSAYIEGLGNTISGLTSPLNLGLTALSGGSSMAAKAGLPEVAQLMNYGVKAASVPVTAEGIKNIYSGETIPEKLMGGLEAIGGIAGLRSKIPEISESIGRNEVPQEIPQNNILHGPETPIFDENGTPIAPPQNNVERPSGPWDKNISQDTPKNGADQIYDLARNKFNMGKDLPVESDIKIPELVSEGAPPIREKTGNFWIDDANRMKDEALSRRADPIRAAEDKAKIDKWNETQENLRVTSELEKRLGDKAENLSDDEWKILHDKVKQEMRDSSVKINGIEHKFDVNQNKYVPIEEQPLQPPTNIKPQFNPKGKTGLTGSLQSGDDVTHLFSDNVDKNTGEVIPPKQPPNKPPNEPPNNEEPPNNNPKKPSIVSEILNTPRALQIGNLHLSAPLRQGLPLITTKAWWTSWDDMFKSFGSQKGYETVMNDIKSHPNFQEGITQAGKVQPSFAESVGLKLTDSLSRREELLGSKWLENIPGYKASNRAFTGYLNKLRADTFNSLIDDAQSSGLNPKKDMVLSGQIANFINNATGRGTLGPLEKHAELLNNAFFAPRKIAGNIQMMNPANYIMTNPFVRKQYLKAMLSTVGAWTTFAGMAKAAGASVSLDPDNADFGKIRIDNTRLDPAGGFQQYLVAGHRLLSGKYTSSTTGKTSDLGGKFGSMTRKDVIENLGANKLNTPFKFAYDLANASKTQPYNVSDQAIRMFIPIVAQDVIELAKEDPRLLPTAVPSAFGMGEQTYGAKGYKQTVIPQNWSIKVPNR